LFEITYTDLKKLKLALDNAEFKLDLTVKEHQEAQEYVIGDFYPIIKETIQGIDTNGTKS